MEYLAKITQYNETSLAECSQASLVCVAKALVRVKIKMVPGRGIADGRYQQLEITSRVLGVAVKKRKFRMLISASVFLSGRDW